MIPSVPHRRGDEPVLADVCASCRDVFPTGVGMNRHAGDTLTSPYGGVPHRRGDEPVQHATSSTMPTCSPQAWG